MLGNQTYSQGMFMKNVPAKQKGAHKARRGVTLKYSDVQTVALPNT